ncbi:hypothetical protein SynBIOSU31_01224 [Synechococcus sp. BIOS-U3-1]|nr:hypothetical protein SynBIOSU31_01224 [Synechococcus sp. BIOS-U3-1]
MKLLQAIVAHSGTGMHETQTAEEKIALCIEHTKVETSEAVRP